LNTFDDTFKDELRQAIHEVEARSGAELVVAVAPRVDRYYSAHLLLGSLAAFTLLTVLMFAPQEIWYVKIYYESLIAFGLGFLILFACDALKRRLIGRNYLHYRVDQHARALFQRAGVYKTRNHTGVLVFVSFFEREVAIIADETAAKAMPRAEWEAVRARFARAFTAKQPAGAVIAAIRESADTFEKHIVRQAGDENELADEPWVD
jgi:putative membrane protein